MPDLFRKHAWLRDSVAIIGRRITNIFAKQPAERSQTFKPYLKADIRDRQRAGGKQGLCFLDALLGQILMGCLIEGLPE